MKKIYVFLGIITLLLIVGYLYNKGLIKVDWQWLSIILAALAGPYKLIEDSLRSKGAKKATKAQQILARQVDVEKQEAILIQQYDALLKRKDLEIEDLRARLQKLEDQLEQLQLERKQIQSQVESMSLEDKAQQFSDYFGS
jgi:flagellar capping protein FliD